MTQILLACIPSVTQNSSVNPSISADKSNQGMHVLVAAAALAVVLGSIHAFSVLLIPLETLFEVSRASVSATYSLALGALTLSVLWGHRIFAIWSADRFVLGIGLLSAAGAWVAAMAGSLPVVWIGYSLLFGGANGLGYGFGLQIAAQANTGREGKAMGTVTAAYALGATVAPALFSYAVTSGGFHLAMLGLAVAILVAASASAALLKISGFKFQVNEDSGTAPPLPPDGLALLWVAYGSGVSGGLMIIGHAAGIASAQRLEAASWIAPAVISVSNLAGSLIVGRLMDHFSARWLLSAFPFISAISVGALALTPSPAVMLACFAGVGFTYGGIIAAYPATIAKVFGAKSSPQIYGRVFTAWGLAGLVAPWLAGKFFAVTGNYSTALWVAAVLATISSGAALCLLSSARLENRLEA